MQLSGSLDDAALIDDGLEHLKIDEIHLQAILISRIIYSILFNIIECLAGVFPAPMNRKRFAPSPAAVAATVGLLGARQRDGDRPAFR